MNTSISKLLTQACSTTSETGVGKEIRFYEIMEVPLELKLIPLNDNLETGDMLLERRSFRNCIRIISLEDSIPSQ